MLRSVALRHGCSMRDAPLHVDAESVASLMDSLVDGLRAGFAGIDPEHLKWTLVGDGQLKAIDAYHYVYLAPPDQIGSKLMRIEIQSVAHPELTGSAMVLVTSADPDTLNSVPATTP